MVNGATPPVSAPLFQADSTDRVILQAIQREQEPLLTTCSQHQSCDQVHFTRAMIALFQNGETAAVSFQQAIAVAPTGPFADSSARWIRILANRTFSPTSPNDPNEALRQVMKGLVRAWLEQQRAASPSVTSRAGEADLAIHTLQRRIRDRDKRIAELTDRFNALKQIDLDPKGTNKLGLPGTTSK